MLTFYTSLLFMALLPLSKYQLKPVALAYPSCKHLFLSL
uniref:Uncharacterized protein n=1 Tax=Arundo donax TaxID=35708 RepID=A0A0A8ZT51_ARUDO